MNEERAPSDSPSDLLLMLQDLNEAMLYILYIFRPGAPLKSYIERKKRIANIPIEEPYTLRCILSILEIIIRDTGMFDPSDPTTIICDPDLESALGKRIVRVTEIRTLVQKQLMIDGTTDVSPTFLPSCHLPNKWTVELYRYD